MTRDSCKSNTYLCGGRVCCGLAKKWEPLALSRREACPRSAVCDSFGLNLHMCTARLGQQAALLWMKCRPLRAECHEEPSIGTIVQQACRQQSSLRQNLAAVACLEHPSTPKLYNVIHSCAAIAFRTQHNLLHAVGECQERQCTDTSQLSLQELG